jgi:hypothetical protein
MWKWSCPSNPQLIWEHHSRKDALESIAAHVGGVGMMYRPPCELVHELKDDGVPCDTPDCNIPYVMEKEGSND